MRGTHVQFDVDLRTGGVRNWTLTGAPNVGRLVERPTVIFSEKTPLHGAVLTRTDRLRNDKGDLVLIRTNGVIEVKIQAKDCAQGGVFQMEIERDDDRPTRFRHVLGTETFYYDNPNFRAREGDVVPFSNSAGQTQNITITPRITSAATRPRNSSAATARRPRRASINRNARTASRSATAPSRPSSTAAA